MGFFWIISATEASLPFINHSSYTKAANRLLEFQKLSPKTYSVLRHNLSFYLRNYIKPQELELWGQYPKEEFLKKIFQRNFWSQKLERDLSHAYSDEEFHNYFLQIAGELKTFITYLQFMNLEKKELKLYLYGSMAKGRFGGKSSLDLLVESDDTGLVERLASGIYAKGNPNFQGNIEVTSSKFGARYILKPLMRLRPQELLDIKSLYSKILNKMGFDLLDQNKRLAIHLRSGLQRYHLEFNPIEDRVYYLSHKSFRLGQEIAGQHGNFNPQTKELSHNDASSLRSKIQKLIRDFEEVRGDLALIQNQTKGERLNRIRSVISKPSYSRLASHRSAKLQGTVESWSNMLSQWLELVR